MVPGKAGFSSVVYLSDVRPGVTEPQRPGVFIQHHSGGLGQHHLESTLPSTREQMIRPRTVRHELNSVLCDSSRCLH